MKAANIGWAVGGVVLGFLLGGIGPRLSLQDTQDALEDAEERVEEAQRGGPASRRSPMPLPGMGELLDPPERAPAPDGAEPNEPSAVVVDDTGGAPLTGPDAPEDVLDRYELAVDAQALRRRQSREALVQQADLSDDEIAQMDDIVGVMNDELAMLGDDVVDLLLMGDEPTPEEMLGLSHDLTGILYEGQLELNDLLGPGAQVDPSAQEIWNHIDLEGLRPAVEAAMDP